MRIFRAVAVLLSFLAAIPGVSSAAAPAEDLTTMVSRMARVGSAFGPSFSPDGKRLAFISNLSGGPQVWTVPAEGGWPTLVTPFEDQVGGVEWSPNSDWLAFTVAPGGGLNEQVYLMQADGGGLTRITPGGKTNNRLHGWSRDGKLVLYASSQRDPGALDSYIYDVASGQSRLVSENPGVGTLGSVSPDGKWGLVQRVRSRGDSNVFLVDLATRKETLLTPHEPPGSFGGARFSADGSAIYLASNGGRDLLALGRIKVSDGKAGPIEVIASREGTELDGFGLSRDGSTAALLWNVAGRSELSFLDLRTLASTPGPKLPGEIAGGVDFSEDGRSLAITLSGARQPPDIWILDRASGGLRQVTHSPHAGVDLASLIAPELVKFRGKDGLEMSGWLYRPAGAAGGRIPVVISYHGGPEGQERPNFSSTYQALLARGIGVFGPNVRGSSGFGKKFINLDNGPLRKAGVEDIAACVEYLVQNGIADPKGIGIMGGSYGGYMVMAGLTQYPDLFAAGANSFGIVNFETFFSHTEPWMAAVSTIEYGDPVTQKDMLRELSPIHKLDLVKAPTLVLHGANDTNVPVVEAEQVVDTLKKRGVPVEYVLFPDEGHGFRKAPNRIRAAVSIVSWFEKYLKPQGAGTTAP